MRQRVFERNAPACFVEGRGGRRFDAAGIFLGGGAFESQPQREGTLMPNAAVASQRRKCRRPAAAFLAVFRIGDDLPSLACGQPAQHIAPDGVLDEPHASIGEQEV